MSARRTLPLSKRELRESIEAYLEAGSDDSFNRMFERDKDDLRELGLVIDTVENLDGEVGYLARRDSNRLPPSPWTPRRPPPSASPPRSGSRPGWPARPAEPCRSCAPPGCPRTSTPTGRTARWSRASRCTRPPSSR
ncbi:hypothetical protein ACFQ3Z_11285 [Streptomyces nogalater]